ncbi:MAG: RHS repeat-associated core domain-containing protein [Verrucomicrobia bacterium]|nr:RHS repeat-associated core domain-containing protein [Verrucomicrobiota bacterium]
MTNVTEGTYGAGYAYPNSWLSSVTRKISSGTQLNQATYAYDAHGRQSTVSDARNGTTTSTFNSADQVLTVTTPSPGTGQPAQVTTSYYDNLSRLTGQLLPDGKTTTNFYFQTGLLQKTSGSRTYPVEHTYDPQGRMKTIKTWQNFAGGSGTAISTWNYGAYLGWLNSKDYADPTTGAAGTVGPDYTYTAAGRMATRLWARGSPRVTATYAYNTAGDLYTVTYNDGTTPGVTSTYDRRGRQKTVVCNGITTTLTYNDANQQLTESYAGGTLGGLTVTSGYDTLLRRTTLALNTTPSSLSYTYAYDTASRLTNVTEGTYGAGYAYLANSPLISQITFKQSSTVRLTTSKDYDKLNRLQSISSAPSSSSSLPLTYAYQYNDANQRVRMTLTDGSFWIYVYDALGQVVSGKRYWSDGTPVPGQQNEYTFDDIGNRRATKSGGDAGGAALRAASYTPNLLNQYTSRTVPGGFDVVGIAPAGTNVTVNSSAADYRRSEYFQEPITVVNTSVPVWQSVSVTTGGGGSASGNVWTPKTPENYGYDLDGNTTSDGRWTYTWDAENRLTRLVANTGVGPQQRLDFEYDWQGRRIRKKVWNNTGGTGTPAVDFKFVYDGWNLTAELDANASSNLNRSYVWGLDLSGSEQGAGGVGGLLLVKPASGNPLFVAYDGNGNVTGLTDATTGTTSAQYEYGPFGETIRMSGTGTVARDNPFRFSTKYQDDESDLLYYGYRYYSPSTGRWLSRDPVGESDTPNSSLFTQNEAIDLVDYLGLWQIKQTGRPRAEVIADCDNDSISKIAKKLGLDPRQSDKWLKPRGNANLDNIKKGDVFTVPNRVIIVVSHHWAPGPRRTLQGLAHFGLTQLEGSGFNVVLMDRNVTTFGRAEVLARVDEDLWGVALIGHGVTAIIDPTLGGDFRIKGDEIVNAVQMQGVQDYGMVIVFACSGSFGGWSSLVSINGVSWVSWKWTQPACAIHDQLAVRDTFVRACTLRYRR